MCTGIEDSLAGLMQFIHVPSPAVEVTQILAPKESDATVQSALSDEHIEVSDVTAMLCY